MLSTMKLTGMYATPERMVANPLWRLFLAVSMRCTMS